MRQRGVHFASRPFLRAKEPSTVPYTTIAELTRTAVTISSIPRQQLRDRQYSPQADAQQSRGGVQADTAGTAGESHIARLPRLTAVTLLPRLPEHWLMGVHHHTTPSQNRKF